MRIPNLFHILILFARNVTSNSIHKTVHVNRFCFLIHDKYTDFVVEELHLVKNVHLNFRDVATFYIEHGDYLLEFLKFLIGACTETYFLTTELFPPPLIISSLCRKLLPCTGPIHTE